MVSLSAIDRLTDLLAQPDGPSMNTSMRLPAALREAAALAVAELGVAPTTTALTTAALRQVLETAVQRAVLDAHYAEHPAARPDLAEVALALAEQNGSPLANHPDLVTAAAAQVRVRRPGATADDVLLWAEARDVMRRSA